MLLKFNQTLLPPTLCTCLRRYFSSMASDSVGCVAALPWPRTCGLVRLPGVLLSSPLSSSDFLLSGFSVSWMYRSLNLPTFLWPSVSFTSSCFYPLHLHLLCSVFYLSLIASVSLDYRSRTLSTWSSASSVEIVIMFLPVSYCWTLTVHSIN